MLKRILDWVPRTIAVAAVGMLLGAGAANGAVIRLTFDPAFGSAFPDLGFAGEAQVSVDDDCLDAVGRIFPDVTPPIGGCGPALITSAHVDLYDVLHGSPLSPLQTLTYAPPTLPDDTVNSIVVDEVVVIGNMVVAISTDIFGPRFASAINVSVPTSHEVFPGGNIWLRFVSNFMSSELDNTFTYNPQAFIYVGANCANPPNDCIESNAAEVVITLVQQQVPEPESLLLVIAALGALGLNLRRRRHR